MLWYVTGGTGLIGRAAVNRLVNEGHHVFVLSRAARSFYQPGKNLEPLNYDVAKGEPQHLLPRPSGHAGLLALASRVTPTRDLRQLSSSLELDTLGHLRLVQLLRPNLRFIVYASSSTVYGWPNDFPVGELALVAPGSVYALCKLASEMILNIVQREWCIPVSIMRIAQVYGPAAHHGAALYQFLEAARKGKRPRITCPPETFRDYCHVDDVCAALMCAIERRATGVFNIGSGKPITMAKLARLCLAVEGSMAEPEIVVQEPSLNMWLDVSKARRELGYLPQMGIEDGVKQESKRLWQG